jgi:tRNA (adenine22-N1)-methyltransferase
MEELTLSKRLQMIAGLVPNGSIVADIGTDHGYLPIYLVKSGIAQKVYAMDVRKAPLTKAAQNVKAYGVQENIELRLSDGLDKLEKNEADTITIAGMGGKLMQSILTSGLDRLTNTTRLILSPQSEIRDFRVFLKENGFLILREHMLNEDGQFYVIMESLYLGAQYSPTIIAEAVDRYGYSLLSQKNESLYEYLKKELRIVENVLEKVQKLENKDEAVQQRIEQLRLDKQCIEVAFRFY